MAHYAKVRDGRVVNIIVATPETIDQIDDHTPGEWIETCKRTRKNQHLDGGTPLRGNYAGIGYVYDRHHDVFYPPQPYSSWVMDQSTWSWRSSVPYPTDGGTYKWHEPSMSWQVFEFNLALT